MLDVISKGPRTFLQNTNLLSGIVLDSKSDRFPDCQKNGFVLPDIIQVFKQDTDSEYCGNFTALFIIPS